MVNLKWWLGGSGGWGFRGENLSLDPPPTSRVVKSGGKQVGPSGLLGLVGCPVTWTPLFGYEGEGLRWEKKELRKDKRIKNKK